MEKVTCLDTCSKGVINDKKSKENLKDFLNRQDKQTLIEYIIKSSNHTEAVSLITESQNKAKESRGRPADFTFKKHMAFKFMYIGIGYEGLVTQLNTTNTIEHQIFTALQTARLVESIEGCNYSRCGRTDKGVSAFGNVFDLDIRASKQSPIDYMKVLNNLLPSDIRIIGQAEVDLCFDSRFSCLFREYKYFFIRKDLDIGLMSQASQKLKGEHNFFNFCKIDKSKPEMNYVRRIYDISIERQKEPFFAFQGDPQASHFDVFCLKIRGSAFLWHQIRCIMGILLEIGARREPVELVDALLGETTYHFNYSIADEKALVLSNCFYEGVRFCPAEGEMQNIADVYFSLVPLYEGKVIESVLHGFFVKQYGRFVSRAISRASLDLGIKQEKICDETIVRVFEESDGLKRRSKYTPLLKRKRK